MLELLFLLLPVAAAYGWIWAAEVRNKTSKMKPTACRVLRSGG